MDYYIYIYGRKAADNKPRYETYLVLKNRQYRRNMEACPVEKHDLFVLIRQQHNHNRVSLCCDWFLVNQTHRYISVSHVSITPLPPVSIQPKSLSSIFVQCSFIAASPLILILCVLFVMSFRVYRWHIGNIDTEPPSLSETLLYKHFDDTIFGYCCCFYCLLSFIFCSGTFSI